MSGKNCFKILDKIFVQKNKKDIEEIPGYTIKYGHIKNKNNEIVDEVLVSYFKEPKSYTTENMCEINSHGGNIVMKQILELCIENGAELAEPGEFTKRAFFNGRIDLSQAEAVIDVINAKTKIETKESINQLQGYLSKRISNIRKKLIDMMVDIDANIDYPEYDLEDVSYNKATQELTDIYNDLNKLEKSFDNGKIIKNGIKVAIIGKPNAGKSSLLNAMLKEERAIVTEYEGTTRDTIEEFLEIDGIPIRIIDTAGIRNAKDEVEKIGIKKSKEVAETADLIIAIFDITKKLDEEDKKILDIIGNKKSIIVLNKIDLVDKVNIPEEILKYENIIEMSALNKQGIEEMYNKIAEIFKFNDIEEDNSFIITNIRHKELIKKANKNIEDAINTLKNNLPIDIISINIKDALENLGNITGENVSENIINEIFKKFCLGK
jgi:tRNA modification GTPase